MAQNEAASREINERIEQSHESASREGQIRMLCECGREDCERVLAITTAEYRHIRSEPERFAVAEDHVIPDLERVVFETDRFVVVAKREGTPAEVAAEEDPTS